VGPDGGSHQMIEDLALMRVLPGMRVLVPADYHSAKAAIRVAAATPGPFYVRLGRAALPEVYPAEVELELGGANVLRHGTDVTIVACGVMVAQALAAADILAADDLSAEVIDAYSIKPLDEDTLLRSARKTGVVVTCEEHSIIGGLGSAVAEVLAEHAPRKMVRVGVRDVFGTSGEPDELMAHYGLMAADIARAATSLVIR
jgi:transketolase